MNMLKIIELNFGIGNTKLGCLDDILRNTPPLIQDLLTGKKRVTMLLNKEVIV